MTYHPRQAPPGRRQLLATLVSLAAVTPTIAPSIAAAQTAPALATQATVSAASSTDRPVEASVQAASELGRAFSDVAARALPSVVSVHVESEAEMPEAMGFFFGPGAEGGRAAPMVRGSGSGVIVRDDGVILTNYHVVERARRLNVHLRDGRVLRGRVLGVDRATDLALVKVDARSLPVARLGDSDRARPGEWVLAIGAPLGLESTVTHGILSATGRTHLGINDVEDYLQTDASINPGNSGGPLVNLRGEVLGINTMIAGRNTGIGFAVSSRIAQFVVDQVLRTGRVSRGWIGVGVQDISPTLAESLRIGDTRGALVNTIGRGAPADRAGLRVGDVVTSIDRSPVADGDGLIRVITCKAPGERIALGVLRAGQTVQLTVTTASRPGANEVADAIATSVAPPRRQGHGLRLAAIDPRWLQRLGITEPALGVAAVDPGSAADDAGLRRGDLLLRVDGAAPMSLTAVDDAARDRRVTLLVRRGDEQRFVPLVLD
jgi:serine protease Do